MFRLSHLKALAVRRNNGGFRTESTMHESEACCATASGEIANPTPFSPTYQTVGPALPALTIWVVAYSNLVPFL